ncbi:MAG: HNH endonuclease [Candidatus Hydrogenedentes bacterium]|nr:HNH endonuclease [Candidatus Hydrogenedentota bacterium]
MSAERKIWNESELLVVFRLYCRTPFGRLHQRNPEIIELAKLIGRTPGAVAMKACNFASLDPHQQARKIRALGNVSRADRDLWEAFLADSASVAQNAEAVYSSMTGKDVEDYLPELDSPISESSKKRTAIEQDLGELKIPSGATENVVLTKTRRVQSFFRSAVLASYDNRCALTGLAISELLNACHIIPWSIDEKRRADPSNGICLNALHDRAFDRGLISFDESLRLIVSSKIITTDECDLHRSQLAEQSGRPLRLPERFQPDKSALKYHRSHIYRP